jgi:hypothetical protein
MRLAVLRRPSSRLFFTHTHTVKKKEYTHSTGEIKGWNHENRGNYRQNELRHKLIHDGQGQM